MARPGRNAAITADREAIRRSGALAFLLDIVAGKPAPVRDAAGRVVDWTDPPELPLRVSTATALVKKVLPDLQAQSIDLQTSGEGVLRLVLSDGLAPPGMRQINDSDGVEAEAQESAEPAHIEHLARLPQPILTSAASKPATTQEPASTAQEPQEPAMAAEEPATASDGPRVRRRRRRKAQTDD